MVSFKGLIVLATMTSAMLIYDRDVNTIQTNLRNIDAAAKKLASDTKAWDGTASGATIVNNDERVLDGRVNSATSEAKSEPGLSSADSKTIVAYFSNPLTPDFKAALDAFVSRKSDFQKSGLTGLAKSDLTSLKADVDALGSMLRRLVSSDQKTNANNVLTTLDGYFNSAIAAFS